MHCHTKFASFLNSELDTITTIRCNNRQEYTSNKFYEEIDDTSVTKNDTIKTLLTLRDNIKIVKPMRMKTTRKGSQMTMCHFFQSFVPSLKRSEIKILGSNIMQFQIMLQSNLQP